MTLDRLLQVLLGSLWLVAAVLAVLPPLLLEGGAVAWTLVVILELGLAGAGLLVWRSHRRGWGRRDRWLGTIWGLGAWLFLLSPWLVPGPRQAGFGWTVVGALPVPLLDLRFDRSGYPALRPKDHLITARELEPLLTSEVEIVVLGIGWQSAVRVEGAVHRLGPKVEALPTGQAVQRYRALRAQGRVVVLVLHSTC